jgi:hypothetical protein
VREWCTVEIPTSFVEVLFFYNHLAGDPRVIRCSRREDLITPQAHHGVEWACSLTRLGPSGTWRFAGRVS